MNDTGIGIEPADRGELFQPFSQVGESMTRKFGGTGLSEKESPAGANGMKFPVPDCSGIRALLVEGSPDNQVLIRRILNMEGIELEVAKNGAEGFGITMTGTYDITVMDLQMPVTDGYEATEKHRKSGYDKPILALTAHAMAEKNRDAWSSGALLTFPSLFMRKL